MSAELPAPTVARVGFYAAVLTSVMTAVTFGFAIIAIPNSGANCAADCFSYPYLDTLGEFPRDYLWMPLATMLALVYVVFMASIHAYAAAERKLFGLIGLSFALLSAGLLAGTYFVQFSVVPASLMRGETEGITLLTQYNPRGVFIALEELGYLIMACSFLCVAPVFVRKGRVEAAVRWVFVLGFAVAAGALGVVSALYGLDRQDRFEIAVIAIDWLVLIVNGALFGVLCRRQLAAFQQPPATVAMGTTG